MYKLALVLAAAIAVVAVASVTDTKRAAQSDPKASMPSIEQLTSKAGDLPEHSYPAF